MSTQTGYIVNNGNYANKDLYTIFQPYTSGATGTTNYKVNNAYFTNKDLGEIFQSYTSGTKASATGYTVNGNDLCNIIAPISLIPTFTFTQGTQPTIETLTVSGNTYYMMKFTTTNVNTTYNFYPNSSIKVYQLFVVSGGSNGASSTGGRGGQVLSYNNASLTTFTTVSGGSSNVFTLTVGRGTNNSTSSFVGTKTPTATNFNFTAIPSNGSTGNGRTNIFTLLPYGGAGGAIGITGLNSQNGGNGFLGGGGGGGGAGGGGFYGGTSGGSGSNGGGNGGPGYFSSTGDPGTNGAAPGGGAGGAGGGSGGNGGGGGGAGAFGGGGGAGATGGGGGSGVILLIFTS
jgi:hypothetical protein